MNSVDKIKMKIKKDGWKNLITGLGRKQDKTTHTKVGDYDILSDPELSDLYMGEGLGKKIVGCVADDMTREGFEIPEDKDAVLSKELKSLNILSTLNIATRWARLFGGSLVVAEVENSGLLSEPLPSNHGRVTGFKVYPKSAVIVNETDIVSDPEHPYFDEIQQYRVITLRGTEALVHASRCIVFRGEPVPYSSGSNLKFDLKYWGMSTLQSGWDDLKNLGSTNQGIAALMQEFSIGVFGISNLEELLTSEEGMTALYNRMEIINASKSTINSVMLGAGETFSRNTASLAGVKDVMTLFQMMNSAVFEIPMTRLFGISPGGQNATGESDLRTYYDGVTSKQEIWLQPPLLKIVGLVNKGIGSPVVEDKLSIEFNSPWSPTQKESVDMKKTQAETDNLYIHNGTLSAAEVRESRFTGEYSHETTVDGDLEPETVTVPTDGNKE